MKRIERVKLSGVTRIFGATAALRGVSLSFRPGPITFVQGPNGAGKSTLLAIVGTVLRPSSGSVSYGALGEDPLEARPHIGWVAHESHCYRDLSTRQNLEFAARLYGVDPVQACAQLADRVDLNSFLDRPVAELSRGQRQRLALARALVHTPSLLLLDEPLTGLDAGSVDRVTAILSEEAARGTIVIVVSHVAGLAERLSGERVVIKRGRVAESSLPPDA